MSRECSVCDGIAVMHRKTVTPYGRVLYGYCRICAEVLEYIDDAADKAEALFAFIDWVAGFAQWAPGTTDPAATRASWAMRHAWLEGAIYGISIDLPAALAA